MRKEKIITIDDRGRQLTFKIREMSASQLESWTFRAVLQLAKGGTLGGAGALELQKAKQAAEEMDTGGAIQAAGGFLLTHGLAALAGIDYDKVKPLLDDLLGCCSRIDAGVEQRLTPEIVDGIIEDMRTLLRLRKEALALNFSFFGDAGPSSSEAGHKQEDSPKPRISVR